MKQYCVKNGMNVFDYTPLSFLFDIYDWNFEKEFRDYLTYFILLNE